MKPILFLGVLITLSSFLGSFYPPLRGTYREYTYHYDGKNWQPIWILCDAPKSVVTITNPNKTQQVHYESFKKYQPADKESVLYRLQEPEGAAGSVFYELNFVNQKLNTDEEQSIREVGDALENQWTQSRSIQTVYDDCKCRWFPKTRFVGITARRSFHIAEAADGTLTYRSFDFKNVNAKTDDRSEINTPSLQIDRGKQTRNTTTSMETFSFNNNNYTYLLEVQRNKQTISAYLSVKQNNKLIQKDRCNSFTYTLRQ